ncbi:GNAT family N-acetyltransferase [Vibrio paucivorans]|uniref:GNAT family N-acetyltransferase n=1 Tax=Vibrio paucivorans TaxID=2829489 RepID=A0A9X3CI23_9VIBR|nr:GNAT family N-acetyltransferase [Vibrio paucivorans]MCW8336214.1 GNAT family N-acetyltransferase [Vibrio paucivorans]
MVRNAEIKDLDVLVTLFIAENEHNAILAPDVVRKTEDVLNESELHDILSDDNQLLIVSEHDGKVVGALLGSLTKVKERRWAQSRTYGYVEELIVSAEARKIGVATGLVSYFSNWASSLGAGSVDLHVWSNNTAAKVLYDSIGFQPKQNLLSKKLRH